MKNKGFTLIELLAVIIILGILMLIAIPSVTNYINNSRKSTYVNTIDQIIKGTIAKVNSGDIEIYDTETTYYVPCTCIKLENGEAKSPYGKFDPAYVVVTFDGDNYNYYFTGKDVQNMGVPTITKSELLTKETIVANVDAIDTTIGINGTKNVAIFNDDCSEIEETKPVGDTVSGGDSGDPGESGGGSTPPPTCVETASVVYPSGKNKSTVVMGDIVKLGSEQFYVMKHVGEKLYLLAKYNLKVGGIYEYGGSYSKIRDYTDSDPGYGLQSAEAKGYQGYSTGSAMYGVVFFSNTSYWSGKVGTEYPGVYCNTLSYDSVTTFTYVYDDNSSIKPFVDNYKEALENMGYCIKEARLMRIEEAFELGCGGGQTYCSNNGAPEWVYSVPYWLGTPFSDSSPPWRIYFDSRLDGANQHYIQAFGARPVIII